MSKKKTLLEEGTMRRFMKLANMEAVGTDFINEMYGAKMKKDEELDEGDRKDDDDTKMRQNKTMEEDIDEAMHDMKDDPMMDDPMKDDPMMDDPMQDDEEMDLDVEDEEEEMDMDAGDMGELTLTDEEAEVFLKVADKVRAAMEMEAPEEMPAPDMGGDMEEPMDEPMDEPTGDMEMDAEEETEEEPMMEDMVNEVARRVARRLNGLKKSK